MSSCNFKSMSIPQQQHEDLEAGVQVERGREMFFLSPGSSQEQRSMKRLPPPEQELTLITLRLAVLEKSASGLGVLAFVWATVVLLGGFVGNLNTTDFWVISVLLLTEGTRVFSRSHELEWQAAAPRISIRAGAKSILNHIRITSAEVENTDHNKVQGGKIVPYASFVTANLVSSVLYYMQLVSALVCVGLAVSRLYSPNKNHSNKNHDNAVGVFYSLVLAEALIFLAERAYWEYQFSYRRLLAKVNRECQLGTDQEENIKRFFYEVYSTCLKGSVFDCLEMDLVSYGMDDIQENNAKEQLGGASILLAFLRREDLAKKTMRRIATKPGVIERLVEMLTWKENHEKRIRSVAAEIVRHVVRQKSISFKIVAVAGALENIVSLLPHDGNDEQLQQDGLRILFSSCSKPFG